MVYTVTCNPAVDYTVRVDGFRPGGIHRSRAEQLSYGGKGINVSVVLTRLGVPNMALGFVAGATGGIIEEAASRECRTSFIHLPGGMSRINVKIASDTETAINGRGPYVGDSAMELLAEQLLDLKPGDYLVLAGSIPASLEKTAYAALLQPLAGREIQFVVDAAGELLLETLACRPFLIKPNLEELQELFETRIDTQEELQRCAVRLQKRGARNVLVSLGEDGAFLLDETGNSWRMRAPRGEVVNTVGSGDSMVAGFLAGYIEKGDYCEALLAAMA